MKWEAYFRLSNLGHQPAQTQFDALIVNMTDDTLRIVQNMGLSDGDSKSVPHILKELETHACGRINEVIERRNLNLRVQQPGESFIDYLCELRHLAKSCGYGDLDCSMIRDRIVVGIRDAATVQKLLAIQDVSLHEAVNICLSMETTKAERGALLADSPVTTAQRTVAKLSLKRRNEFRNKKKPDSRDNVNKTIHEYTRCGEII